MRITLCIIRCIFTEWDLINTNGHILLPSSMSRESAISYQTQDIRVDVLISILLILLDFFVTAVHVCVLRGKGGVTE